MFKHLFISIFLLSINLVYSQNLYFPPLTGNQWDTLSPSSLGWCTNKIDSLYLYLEQRNTKAFIVLKDGKIVLEKYFGTFISDSVWYWASAGKTLTAFTVGIAQQEGYLSIYDTTSHYLGTGWTSCTPQQEEKITIRHQLTMTSGLDDDVPNTDCTIDTCLIYKADAGTRWAYHNAPYTLLDNVIQSATGQNLNTYFTNKVKIHTGITGNFINTGFNNVFYSKTRSMARFGLLILNKGNWNGNQIMTDSVYFNEMVSTSQSLNESYGYLWWLNGKNSFMVPSIQFTFQGSLIPSAPNDLIAALGKNGQIINVVPSKNMVVVRMGNAPTVTQFISTTFNDTIWQKLNDIMCQTQDIKDNTKPEFQIFPNPAKNTITIQTNAFTNNNVNIKIYNKIGETVYEEKTLLKPNHTINVEPLQKGIYILDIIDESEYFIRQKIIISN